MRKIIGACVIFTVYAFSQDLPIFLKADSIAVEKLLRTVGSSFYTSDFLHRFERGYVETVLVSDSICDNDTCYPSGYETLRVVVDIGDSALIELAADTFWIYGDKKKMQFALNPFVDRNTDSSGDEYYLLFTKDEPFCDTIISKDGQSVLCQWCGRRKVFEFWYPESAGAALLLRRTRIELYPEQDSCRSRQVNIVPFGNFVVKDETGPVQMVDESGEIILRRADDIVPVTRKPVYRKDALINLRYNPDSILTTNQDTAIIPFLVVDGSWLVRWKWIWGEYAAESGTYIGYAAVWDDIPWGGFEYTDEGLLQVAMAAPAQYCPISGGDTLGYVDSVIALLESDGIADDSLFVCYPRDTVAEWGWHRIRDIFYKNFNSDSSHCPIVFSRPVDTLFTSAGNLCDNSRQVYFCSASEACDGVGGMASCGHAYFRDFWADALHFYSAFSIPALCDLGVIPYSVEQIVHSDPELVLYIIAAGSVPRIWINGNEYIVSPSYFPPYGDPYGYVLNGYRAVIDSPAVDWYGLNTVEVEHVSPLQDGLGAQVVFALRFCPPSTSLYIQPICEGDTLILNAPLYSGTEVADSGQARDTAVVAGVDSLSAVLATQNIDGVWQPVNFTLSDSTVIVIFDSTLTQPRRWRWWFFSRY